MDIITFSIELERRMKERLNQLDSSEDELIKTGKILAFVKSTVNDLEVFTENYHFADESEEIRFFKEINPLFLGQLYYYQEVFSIKLFDSFKDLDSRQANYVQLLGQLEKFAKEHLQFYEYVMASASHLDRDYFVTSKNIASNAVQETSSLSKHHSILPRILANELLKKYVLDLLSASRHPTQTETNQGLSWTGSKTDLVELIYALSTVDAFNKGNASIKQIASAFEKFLNINLGDYYRTFQDIRLRKKSQAPFLDNLREKFINHAVELNR